MRQFEPLVHRNDSEFFMMADVSDLKKIEAKGIKHVQTIGHFFDSNSLLIEMILVNGQLQFKSIKSDSLLIKRCWRPHALELAKDMYLVKNRIFKHMTVLRELDINSDSGMSKPIKVPYFDMERLPFVIFIDF